MTSLDSTTFVALLIFLGVATILSIITRPRPPRH